MDIESIREYCLSFPLTTECFPFDEYVLVFKVEGKMFLYTDLSNPEPAFNVKCDPEFALDLREKYNEVMPGFHSNKKYWNTVYITPRIGEKLIKEWIRHSYEEVVKKMPKYRREPILKLLDETII